MARDEDDAPRPPAVHEIGQPLDTLSVEEIGERIAALKAEIERLEQARAAKEASRSSAAAFFKTGG
ncbi:MAG TPA: DUF1192 domain-containing protein [Methylovirgula sp.]|nr:DUF1192 domain-containing protein [Methylovirgula sp.]